MERANLHIVPLHLWDAHATDPPAKSSETIFFLASRPPRLSRGLYRANDGNDVLDDLRKKPTANEISANGKTRLNQHFLGALNSLLREVDMRIVVQSDVLIIRQLQRASTVWISERLRPTRPRTCVRQTEFRMSDLRFCCILRCGEHVCRRCKTAFSRAWPASWFGDDRNCY